MKIHTIAGGDGLKLHVREWGKPHGATILLIHGWSQNHLSWQRQFESELADEFRLVALDIRRARYVRDSDDAGLLCRLATLGG